VLSVPIPFRGGDQLKLREDWRPYIVAVIATPVTAGASSEWKTGVQRAVRTLRQRDGGLELMRRAA
jgi:hypothetical protein